MLAAGGTHIVDWQAGVAAIGNFTRRPWHTGAAMRARCWGRLCGRPAAGCITTIVLNVDQRNAAAQRLYRRHGFVVHCAFVEGCVNSKTEDC